MERLNKRSPLGRGRPSPARQIKKAECKALASLGISNAEIAKRLQISAASVYNYLRPADKKPAPAAQRTALERRVKHNLASHLVARIMLLREEGRTVAEISDLTKIPRDKIYRILRAENAPTGLRFAKSKEAEILELHRAGVDPARIGDRTGFSIRSIYRLLAAQKRNQEPIADDDIGVGVTSDRASLATWESKLLRIICGLQPCGFHYDREIAVELNRRGILNQTVITGNHAGSDGSWSASTIRYFRRKHADTQPPPELVQQIIANHDTGSLLAIRRLHAAGYTTADDLVTRLNYQGLKTRTGHFWSADELAQVLQRAGWSELGAPPPPAFAPGSEPGAEGGKRAIPFVLREPSKPRTGTPDPRSLSRDALRLRLSRWLDERCQRVAEGKARAPDLYRDFCVWAESRGEAFPTSKSFCAHLAVITQTQLTRGSNALEMLPIIKKLQPLCFGSNTKIARKLNGRQYRTIEDRHWTSTDVEQVLEIGPRPRP